MTRLERWQSHRVSAIVVIVTCRGVAGPIVATMRAFIFAVAALVALAPVANASPADDQYLAVLKERNIGGAPDKMIGYALAACDAYGTPDLFAGQVEHMQAIGYTEFQTKTILGLGMQAYCPDKLAQGRDQPPPPVAPTPMLFPSPGEAPPPPPAPADGPAAPTKPCPRSLNADCRHRDGSGVMLCSKLNTLAGSYFALIVRSRSTPAPQ